MSKLAIFGGTPVRANPFYIKEKFSKGVINDVNMILSSGHISGLWPGKWVQQLENKMIKLTNRRYAVTTSCGTDALIAGLASLEIRKGDYVAIPGEGCSSILQAVCIVGAIPIFIDLNDDYGISIESLAKAMALKPKAIIAVHAYGIPFQRESILEICRRYHVKLIEDCSQASGADFVGISNDDVSSDLEVFSFGQGKIIQGGEGGILLTNDKKISNIAIAYCRLGKKTPSSGPTVIGRRSVMSEISASLALSKLNTLKSCLNLRRKRVEYYVNNLSTAGITFPGKSLFSESAFHKLVCLLPTELSPLYNAICTAIVRENVPVQWCNRPPLYRSILAKKMVGDIKPLTGIDRLFERTLLLPTKNVLPMTVVDDICSAIVKVCKYYL